MSIFLRARAGMAATTSVKTETDYEKFVTRLMQTIVALFRPTLAAPDQPGSRPFDLRIEAAAGDLRKSIRAFAAAGSRAFAGIAAVRIV